MKPILHFQSQLGKQKYIFCVSLVGWNSESSNDKSMLYIYAIRNDVHLLFLIVMEGRIRRVNIFPC